MPTSASTQPPRRLTHCPSCGYSLNALPDAGVCPECGQPYDQSAYILYAEARGHHATLETSNAPRAMMQGLAFLIILLILLHQLLRPHRLHLMDYAIYGTFLLAIVSILIKRLTADRPGLVQIWLTPHGCTQEDDLAPGSFINALTRYAALLLCLALLVSVITDPHWRPNALYMIVPVVFASLPERRHTGRFFWTASPPGPPRLTPWSDVATLAVTHEDADRYRIRITPTRRFWRLRNPLDIIDAAITCPPDQAHRLSSDAHQWLHQARHPAPPTAT